MPTTSRQPVASQALINEYVETLSNLVDEEKFAQKLADTVMTPVEDEHDAAIIAAFRDPRLINRSVAAANYLVTRANNDMRRRVGPDASNKDLARRTAAYLAMVGRERQILKDILKGLKATRGILDASPNPRERTKERVYQSLLAGKVITPTRAREILEEEEEKVRAEKRAAKKRAAEAKKAARAAESGPRGGARTDSRANGSRQGESTRSFSDRDVAVARARQGGSARVAPSRNARAYS